MKKILAALFCFCCSSALAQTAQELIDNGKNSENVTTFGMGYNLNQYSPLAQINKSNIKRLVPVWSTALSNDAGELAQPTICSAPALPAWRRASAPRRKASPGGITWR